MATGARNHRLLHDSTRKPPTPGRGDQGRRWYRL